MTKKGIFNSKKNVGEEQEKEERDRGTPDTKVTNAVVPATKNKLLSNSMRLVFIYFIL